jgi:hypothetical protein
MFIYSIRASTLKFFGVILLSLVLSFGLVIAAGGERTVAVGSRVEIDYGGIKTKEDRIAFMEKCGVKVDAESEEQAQFRMPPDFDRVILGYNELQKKQGLDLSKYKNKRVTRYTYKLVGEDAYANLFVYRGKIVACDVSSSSPDGYVLPLTLAKR